MLRKLRPSTDMLLEKTVKIGSFTDAEKAKYNSTICPDRGTIITFLKRNCWLFMVMKVRSINIIRLLLGDIILEILFDIISLSVFLYGYI